jgi:hypothetical protein
MAPLAASLRQTRLFLTFSWVPMVLAACSLVDATIGGPTLRDARVEAVEVVGVPTSEMAVGRELPLLLVRFSTDRDLGTYARDYSSTIHIDRGLCIEGAAIPSNLVSGSLFESEASRYISAYPPTSPRADGRYAYRFYLDLPSRARNLGSGRAFIDHDYRRNNGDICFHFSGGAMLGGTHRSPGFRIPYALIADALTRAGLPYAAP